MQGATNGALASPDFFARAGARLSLAVPPGINDPTIIPSRGDHDLDGQARRAPQALDRTAQEEQVRNAQLGSVAGLEPQLEQVDRAHATRAAALHQLFARHQRTGATARVEADELFILRAPDDRDSSRLLRRSSRSLHCREYPLTTACRWTGLDPANGNVHVSVWRGMLPAYRRSISSLPRSCGPQDRWTRFHP